MSLRCCSRPSTDNRASLQLGSLRTARLKCRPVSATGSDTDTKQSPTKDDAKSTTEKWGLEAGLFKVFTSKEETPGGPSKGQQAKELLARYGSAYLITSISFSIVSFGLCYVLVNSGVDVAALLGKVGITVSATSEKVGTFAIAYAAHKALSPVRFPPTVALTPVVAKALGKKVDDDDLPPPARD